jgi:penicillin G amidase
MSASRRRKIGGRVLALGGLVLLALTVTLYLLIRRSLPQLEGTITKADISAPVTIERDGLGIPTITGKTRRDIAFATGFVHAQDRLFQMDLLRRNSAGELAELLGPIRLPFDRQRRVHRFRHRAEEVCAGLGEPERELMQAYSNGVNAVIERSPPPPEYLVLGSTPRRWQPADCILVIYSMALSLQDPRNRLDRMEEAMQRSLPEPLIRFLTKQEGDWDGALWAEAPSIWPLPPAEVFDLRRQQPHTRPETRSQAAAPTEALTGASNCWAVTGDKTFARKGALLSNDMHLPLAVPNIWYRARFIWDGSSVEKFSVTGATLPGTFPMIIGSNGSIAWGYTNACVDTMDFVKVIPSEDSSKYQVPTGNRSFEVAEERILVKGGSPEVTKVVSTVWGPIIGQDVDGHSLALQWSPHFPNATNWNWLKMETAVTVAEAIEAAHHTGPLTLNMIAADRSGSIGWTLSGPLPVRSPQARGTLLPGSDPHAMWQGWLPSERYPRIVTVRSGFVWSANNRAVGTAWSQEIGDGGYDEGARACQIRNALRAQSNATAADMLSIQLDDRAVFLERWKDLFLRELERSPDDERFRRMHELVKGWNGHARPDQAGYFLVAKFREYVTRRTFTPLFSTSSAIYPEFDFHLLRLEYPLWQMLEDEPAHLLDPQYGSWSDLCKAAAVDVSAFFRDSLDKRGTALGPKVAIRHPLSRSLPVIGWLLDMPSASLPGGHNGIPRVQRISFGASQRMVVEPGHEEQGYFQMPCGQSGHPFSPHYRDSQKSWVEAERQPFLPGATLHVLTLQPK